MIFRGSVVSRLTIWASMVREIIGVAAMCMF
jgi:hypothetical protein